jgi:hypothetical protein
MSYELKRWEYRTLLIESILVSGVASAAFMGVALLPALSPAVQFLLKALAFAMPGVFLWPVLNAYSRNRKGRELSTKRFVWIPIAGLVGATLDRLLH